MAAQSLAALLCLGLAGFFGYFALRAIPDAFGAITPGIVESAEPGEMTCGTARRPKPVHNHLVRTENGGRASVASCSRYEAGEEMRLRAAASDSTEAEEAAPLWLPVFLAGCAGASAFAGLLPLYLHLRGRRFPG